MIKMIMAVDQEMGIGRGNSLPWHHKDDMMFFKNSTIGKGNNLVVMGRKTYESLGDKFPLKERKNIVLSSTIPGEGFIKTIEDLFVYVSFNESKYDDVWIIGGKSIYEQFIKYVIPEEIYISHIKGFHNCDVFVPDLYKKIREEYKVEQSNDFGHWGLEVFEKEYLL